MDASKWIISTRNKLKLALALTAVMLLLVAAKYVEKRQVERMDNSFLSIYADRLVPATAIFKIREQLYQKQELHRSARQDGDLDATRRNLEACNAEITVLLTEYKKTYFWKEETAFLEAFERDLAQYNREEQRLLQQVHSGEQALYSETAAGHFDRAVQNLSALNALQSSIGKNLLQDSKKDMSGFLLLSYVELILIFLFGVLAHVLIYASRAVIQRRADTFHMN